MSIQGGLDLAVERAKRAGCDALQIFTKSSNQWRAKELTDEDIARFRSCLATHAIGPVSAHDSYLINLASPDEALYRRSVDAFAIEMDRCERLGAAYLIAHPGAHMGSGIPRGIRRMAAALDEVLGAMPSGRTRVLLEITAGQGSVLGSRFEEIAGIMEAASQSHRLGVCFDTCHAFASGYDLRTEQTYEDTFRRFDRVIGLDRLLAFHINDSRKELGSRLDRHEHIGKGWMGLEPFRLLVNDARFAAIPMYLETPKGPELLEDIANLATLRGMMGDAGPKAWSPPLPPDRLPKEARSRHAGSPARRARGARRPVRRGH